jgi:hypothetical protein
MTYSNKYVALVIFTNMLELELVHECTYALT